MSVSHLTPGKTSFDRLKHGFNLKAGEMIIISFVFACFAQIIASDTWSGIGGKCRV